MSVRETDGAAVVYGLDGSRFLALLVTTDRRGSKPWIFMVVRVIRRTKRVHRCSFACHIMQAVDGVDSDK